MMSSCIGKAINMEQKVFEFDMPGWHCFASKKFFKSIYEKRKTNSTNNPDDLGITGKYLFFNSNPDILKKVAREEIANNGFDIAKIATELLGTQTEYVLCLYYKDDSRKDELAKKYQEKNGIKYRYWKSDEDTLKGNYSKQFREEVQGKNS